jgi:ribonucleoside-diphosphate reductase alpha chain
VPSQDEDLGKSGDGGGAEVAITKLASSGYLRGRTQISVVKGGAAPKMLAEEEHFHQGAFQAHNDQDDEDDVDLSEIRASVEASIATTHTSGVSAQVAHIEAAMSAKPSARDTRAVRAAEARLKGFEGDSCGSCGNFTLVRNGTCMKCNTCGSTSGCS